LELNDKEMKTDAKFSKDRIYRYALWRIWDDNLPKAMFIGLNPSTADETKDDPTVRRCRGFAKSWRFGGLIMANIFAYRATEPEIMKSTGDPIGPENDEWLLKLTQEATLVIGAWGNHGEFRGRGKAVLALIPHLHCLKMNKAGHPAHPLYLPSELEPKLINTAK
jgi:hypothetical protein